MSSETEMQHTLTSRASDFEHRMKPQVAHVTESHQRRFNDLDQNHQVVSQRVDTWQRDCETLAASLKKQQLDFHNNVVTASHVLDEKHELLIASQRRRGEELSKKIHEAVHACRQQLQS